MANIREITLNILIEYDRDGVRKPSLLKDSLEKYDYLETRDKAFIKRCVDGCLERQIQIDYILDSFSKVKTAKMQPFIRSLLRMSVYQIMFMDAVPDSAACNEAVKLANKHKFSGLKSFVNGVLRNIARNKDKIEYPDKNEDGGVKYLSVLYSMPEWICEMWLTRYGFDKTEEMLKFFLLPRPTVIRLNSEKVSEKETDAYIKELEDQGVVVKRNPILPYALELEKTDNIRFLPGFDEGRFFVQDVSSMLVTQIAAPGKDQVVVDVCAAPGGKSLHAAEHAETVLSRDVSGHKCDLISENAERMGLSNVKVEEYDARVHDRNLEGKADILYLDLPCSGLGIIGRKNDIKYNATRKGLSDLATLQWDIIKTAWDYVKPGGILMYSTCTVNSKENEEMVQKIIAELPFKSVDISEEVPDKLKECDSLKNGYIQLLPGEYGTDGFFIAKLRRD
ncbi:MAG: 16S rRNA (cytosine(967)-C(5))-methyltransferase RsmB [Butyrivibrio sp.]|nr:16S rRNA (cytosine(967)-C(5))-methyltransferase RsmB [Butyrivibrio sp.]